MASRTIFAQITTATIGGMNLKDSEGNDLSNVTYKIYDSNDVEVTNPLLESNAVKSVLYWQPDFKYEMPRGAIMLLEQPFDADVFLWVLAVPEVSKENGGSQEVIQNMNLRYLKGGHFWFQEADPTNILSPPYNGIKAIIKHTPGDKRDIQLCLGVQEK